MKKLNIIQFMPYFPPHKWWFATTLLQAMQLWCFIIATPYEWANEVIENWKNGILLNDDKVETFKNWIIKALENLTIKDLDLDLCNDYIKKYFEKYIKYE
jgi:glycosyltransferase involved in cell wall biosynthesis